MKRITIILFTLLLSPIASNAQFESYKYEPTYTKLSDSEILLIAEIAKENKELLNLSMKIMKLYLGIKFNDEITQQPQSDETLRKEFKNILEYAEKLPKDYKIAYYTKDVKLIDKLVFKALDEYSIRK